MTGPIQTSSPGVRPITLDAGGIPLSALLAEPTDGGTPPRAVVVAVHGGGMRAGYFDGQAHPSLSLMALGARLGYTVLALDRPGYGESAVALPEGQTPAEQSMTVHAALKDFTSRYATGEGILLLAHSYGGKLALTVAADCAPSELIGLDISGCGLRYAVEPEQLPGSRSRGQWARNWGPLCLYPPNTFRASAQLIAPMPARERSQAAHWPEHFPDVASRVRVPVRLTFAEHECWWQDDDTAVQEITSHFGAPRVTVDRQWGAGHNISLGWAARSYHLRALAFLEECLAQRDARRDPVR
ncbi:alpha/beta fold hydrolase [Streptomyces sp. 21So2-11]|uniref:alpha/beta hydrolase n=1 Tax=Streptomyces sp. 21So2-11 TaxID=3144408 RepID=UPI0032191EC7